MSLNKFIDENYKYLFTVAKRIANSQAGDLINSTYLSLYEKQLPSDNTEAIKYFSKCMSNNFRQQRSDYNRTNRSKEIICDDGFFSMIIDETAPIISNDEIEKFKRSLPEHEKLIFELRYEEDVSLRSIAEEFRQIGIDESVLRKINKPIKNKIIKKWKE